MNRNSKSELVANLQNMYSSHNYVFIVNTTGLLANTNNTIRKQLTKANAITIVAKNTLNDIAVRETSHAVISQVLVGQNMSIFAKDPVEVAKVLSTYAKDATSGIKIIGISDGKNFYGESYVKTLATMPSMEVIRASLLSVIQSVPRKIAYSLLYCPTAIGRVISSNFNPK